MPNAWIEQIFDARIVLEGGTVRRYVGDVVKYGGGVDQLLEAAEKRGFHVVQIGDQLVVLCNKGDIKLLR